ARRLPPTSLVRTGQSARCFRVVDGGACGSPGGIVADARAAVTDTHPLLFHAAGGRRLGRRAARLFAAAEARTALIYVPTAVMWETSLLSRVGRVDLRRSLRDRKSTRLNSSHVSISYAVFCLKKKYLYYSSV